MEKGLQNPTKTTFRKTMHEQRKKNTKITTNWLQRGVPGGTSNVVFGDVGAPGRPWGPTWLPDLPPGHPRPLRTLIFNDFGFILG